MTLRNTLESSASPPGDRPLLRGWHWRLLGWAVALFVLGSIGYAIIVLLAALLESRAL